MATADKQQPLMEVNNLKKYFELSKGLFKKEKLYLKAVDGVSLKIYPGETFGIVGESGCGKSTLGNVMMRLLEPTEGEIVFDGVNLSSLTKAELRIRRKNIQMVFQDPFSSLNPRLRVGELIAEPLRAYEVLKGRALSNRVAELMETVGLSASFASRYPHEFSGGQRQRIGIARALALHPKLIICDEAVSALDVSIQAQILNLLDRLQKEFNLTYVFIAHGLPTVKHISDRVAVMYLGKVMELAPKERLFTNPRHPYTQGLLAAVPIPDPELRNPLKSVLLRGELPSPLNPPSGCRFSARCSYANERCRAEEPPLEELDGGHWVACHYPLDDGKSGARL